MAERRGKKSPPPKGTRKQQPLSVVGRATLDLHRNLEANLKGHVTRHKDQSEALGIAAVVVGRLLGQVLAAVPLASRLNVREHALEACDEQLGGSTVTLPKFWVH